MVQRSFSAFTIIYPVDTLIVTGTVNPGKVEVVLANPIERLCQYIASLTLWATQGPFDHIVFCENSNQGRRLDAIKEAPCWTGKKLEIISFNGNGESQILGKGFGEALILETVLRSGVIKDSECFWKITGRLYVENSGTLFEAHKDTSNVMDPMDTRFCKWNRRFYEDNMIGAHKKVDERGGMIIETIYTLAADPFRASGEVSSFFQRPKYVGQGGGTGEWYGDFKADVYKEAEVIARKIGYI